MSQPGTPTLPVLPFAYDVAASDISCDTTPPGQLEIDDAARRLNTMFNEWRITDATEKTVIFNSILKYFILHAPSDKSTYAGEFVTNVGRYPRSVIGKVLGGDARRWIRAYADYASEIAKKCPIEARRNLVRMRLPTTEEWIPYGFDGSDHCTNIPDSVYAKMLLVRQIKTRGTQSMSTESAREADHETMMDSQMPSSGQGGGSNYPY